MIETREREQAQEGRFAEARAALVALVGIYLGKHPSQLLR
jgi:hypothetical protein